MKIIVWPDPRLSKVSEQVIEAPEESFLNEMYACMYRAGGVGLSAVQVGVHKQIVIMDAGSNASVGSRTFLNPVITKTEGELVDVSEGCLSLPGYTDIVKRYPTVEVEHGLTDAKKVDTLNGLEAQIIQHEIEHLSGKLMVDRISSAERGRLMGNFQKLKIKGIKGY